METSKVEFLAQKQNRVAQHRLNDRMTQIDRDFTLSKLATRIFIKQLRYDIAQVKKCTGHSPLARPPTGEEDTRGSKRLRWALPVMPKSAGVPQTATQNLTLTSSAHQQVRATFPSSNLLTNNAERNSSQAQREKTNLSLADINLSNRLETREDKPSSSSENEGLPKLSEGNFDQTNMNNSELIPDSNENLLAAAKTKSKDEKSAFFLTQTSGKEETDQRPTSNDLLNFGESEELFSQELPDGQLERKDILARIEEAKRIINMPSVYQTSKLKSNRDMKLNNRVLPPIAVSALTAISSEADYKKEKDELKIEPTKEKSKQSDKKPSDLYKNNHAAISTEGESNNKKPDEVQTDVIPEENTESTKHENRISFTHRNSADSPSIGKSSKGVAIQQLLQSSLAKAARQRRADRRERQRQKAKTKLAIEAPEGLFRPENIKLIHQTFKKEELYLEHKELLAQNSSQKHVPVPSLLGMNKLQNKLQAFLQKD